jgi:hypothetical protein
LRRRRVRLLLKSAATRAVLFFLGLGFNAVVLRSRRRPRSCSPSVRVGFDFSHPASPRAAPCVRSSIPCARARAPGSRNRAVKSFFLASDCFPASTRAGARQGHVFSPVAVVRAQCLIFTGSSKCGLSSKSLACVIYFLSSSGWFHRPCATRLFSSSSVVAPACVQSLPLTVSILIFVCSRVRVYELLQEIVPVFVLSHWIKRLKELWFKLLSHVPSLVPNDSLSIASRSWLS